MWTDGCSAVRMRPDRLERVHDCAVETFALVDSRKVLFVALDGVAGSKVGLELTGTNVTLPRKDGNSVIYAAVEAKGDFVRISALNPDAQLSFDGKVVEAPRNAGGFITPTAMNRRAGSSPRSSAPKGGSGWLSGSSGCSLSCRTMPCAPISPLWTAPSRG